MVATPISPTNPIALNPPASAELDTQTAALTVSEGELEGQNPERRDFQGRALEDQDLEDQDLEGQEFVDGQWIEKSYMSLKHASTQATLAACWVNHSQATTPDGKILGGKVFTEALCQTQQQRRRPDVAYITPELLAQYGYPTCFPVSFPLVAEVASPEDSAEMLFSKAYEYLASGTAEVWLLYPESRIAIAITQERWQIYTAAETLATQTCLPGFSIVLSALFP